MKATRIWIITASGGLERTEQVKRSNSVCWTDRLEVLTFLIKPSGWPRAFCGVPWLVECILKFATWPSMALHQLPTLELSRCNCTKCYWLETEVMNLPIYITQSLTNVSTYIIYLFGLSPFWYIISQWPGNNLGRTGLGTWRQCRLTHEETKIQKDQLFNWPSGQTLSMYYPNASQPNSTLQLGWPCCRPTHC